MVKGKNIRFIGNVLPATGHRPEGDSTFDFNSDESRRLDLTGVPLRIEHQGSLPIGKVTKSWDGKNGSKWIMGEIESEKGFASLYANHAIKPDSTGHTLYKGLSLQHVHQAWADGTTNKRPVEISICGEPRRPDCYIRAVSETGKNEYIAHKASVNSTMATEQSNAPTTTETPTESTPVNDAVGTTPTESAPVETAPPSQEEQAARNVANSQEELMKMFLAQDGKNNELSQQLAAMKREKEALEAKWKEREANEQIQTQSKAEALSKALVEQWSNQLGPENMTEENKRAIFALAQEHPQASMQMMEIAHKASAKYANTRSALIESEAMSKKRVLEQQVVDTIMKRRRSGEAPIESSHAASTKTIAQAVESKPAFNPFVSQRTAARVENTFASSNAHLFNALKGASQGNARSVMDSIAKYRNGNL
tara:strand:+ start:129 stop:1400 length:1272 start_codon:yes stop_codon:yes gene_type:complete